MSDLKVLMIPHLTDFRTEESGIRRVVEAYFRYLPKYGIELVHKRSQSYDVSVSHAGSHPSPDVLVCHGLYWTADYYANTWEWAINADVIAAAREAKQITVPSRWVAESFQRDMRISPHVIGHGIEWDKWQDGDYTEGYVLWNKNRTGDVCDPRAVEILALSFPNMKFMTTFTNGSPLPNVRVTGLLPHYQMAGIIKRAGVYLGTTKETFGIGVLEAMASGVPVLGWAHGGNLDLVIHGVTGYLARPGDYEDLRAGLAWILSHWKTLSANSREVSRQFTWDAAAAKMAEVYRLAAQPIPSSITVVLPSFNYGTEDKLGRAIKSVLAQTRLPEQIIVVDDGSPDAGATDRLVAGYIHAIVENKIPTELKYIRQNNAGVANARNNGIGNASGTYICCLDADDAIDPTFLEICVNALDKDRSLGIAYTGLRYITKDGQEGVSKWPGDFNYDKMLVHQNQIPTCCVFRKEMWRRLGGFRQRYAPHGAGSEDAEFWLRSGAYGWNAAKVTQTPLFFYSWGTGRVSGDKNYHEVDWTAWHPWVKDGQHPFASVATPKKRSHPVRQYDEPGVSVIIPVGPNHLESCVDALDSLEAQTFRKWEAILVMDFDITVDGDRNNLRKDVRWIMTTYPYARIIAACEPGEASHGAGYARNIGVKHARANLLLFLDADDWLYPEAIQKMIDGFHIEESIVYTDYVGKAYVSVEEARKLHTAGRLLAYDENSQSAVISHKSSEYDCQRAISQPSEKLYIWCLITALLKKEWHNEIGGFDEKMPSWEDWDYWIRMARAGKCFTRVPEPLVVYRFYTGERRERGLHEAQNLIEYLRDKYKETTAMCTSCGKKTVISQGTPAITPATAKAQERMPTDVDVVLVLYNHPNRGQHKVIGPASKRDYGYRGGGEKFYVEKRDMVLMPHLFVEIVPEKQAVTPEPIKQPPAPDMIEQAQKERSVVTETIPSAYANVTWPGSAVASLSSVTKTQSPSKETITPAVRPVDDKFDLQTIPGVSFHIAAQLNARGVHNAKELVELGSKELQMFKGIGPSRAMAIIEATKKIVLESGEADTIEVIRENDHSEEEPD